MSGDDYKQGDRVKFTGGPFGMIDPTVGNGFKFADETVADGDTGTVAMGVGTMPDGWLAVAPDAFPDRYVPVHPGMIERVTE